MTLLVLFHGHAEVKDWLFLAIKDFADDQDSVVAELAVVPGVHQLQQDVHFLAFSEQGRREHILHRRLLARGQLLVNHLLH